MAFNERKVIELGLTGFLILLSIYIAWNLLTPLVFGMLLAYFAFPVHKRLRKKIGRNISALAICVFFAAVLLAIINYGIIFIRNEIWIMYLKLKLSSISISPQIQNIIDLGADKIITSLSTLIAQIPSIIILSFIFFITLFYFLRDGERLTDWFELNFPMPRRKKIQVFNGIKKNIDAFVHVTVLIGIIQALIAGIGFTIFGLGYPAIAGVAAGLLSLLPIVGPYFLYAGVAAFLIFSGAVGKGISILIYGIVLGSILDYAARPLLLGRKAKIHPLIMFIGIFGGLSTLGLIGVLIGPIILTIALAFFKDIGRDS